MRRGKKGSKPSPSPWRTNLQSHDFQFGPFDFLLSSKRLVKNDKRFIMILIKDCPDSTECLFFSFRNVTTFPLLECKILIFIIRFFRGDSQIFPLDKPENSYIIILRHSKNILGDHDNTISKNKNQID